MFYDEKNQCNEEIQMCNAKTNENMALFSGNAYTMSSSFYDRTTINDKEI